MTTNMQKKPIVDYIQGIKGNAHFSSEHGKYIGIKVLRRKNGICKIVNYWRRLLSELIIIQIDCLTEQVQQNCASGAKTGSISSCLYCLSFQAHTCMSEQHEMRKQKTTVTILFIREVYWSFGPLITDVVTHLCLPLSHVHTLYYKMYRQCMWPIAMYAYIQYSALLYVLRKQHIAQRDYAS